MKSRPVSEAYFKDTSGILPFQRTIKARFDNLKYMIGGSRKIASVITREEVLVNLPAWYDESSCPKDLKKLFGIAPFRDEKKDEFISDKEITIDEQKVTLPPFRNYLKGSSINWDLSQYSQIFPGVMNGQQLIDSARILSQSWGGGLIAMPLANYLN